MLKNILKLEGAQRLTNNEQKSISGGIFVNNPPPPPGLVCCESTIMCGAPVCVEWATVCTVESDL